MAGRKARAVFLRKLSTNQAMNSLQKPLEAGKHYVTRKGVRVRIYATDGREKLNCHGAWMAEDGWRSDTWSSLGSYTDNASLKDFDIVGPWIDKPVINAADMPAWCSWAAMDSCGVWYAYGNEPVLGPSDWFVAVGYMVVIPSAYAPKWSGDWKDSLIKFR